MRGQGRGLRGNLAGGDPQRVSGVRGGAPARRRRQDRGVPDCRDAARGGCRADRRGAGSRQFPQGARSASYRCSCRDQAAGRRLRAAAISARISARSASIEIRPFGVSTCQNVQPLQASRPCASAPMRWIEPTCFAERDRAVGAHQRLVALLGVDQLGAGRDQAALEQRRERHARRFARGHERRQRRRFQRLDRGDALAAPPRHRPDRARCR